MSSREHKSLVLGEKILKVSSFQDSKFLAECFIIYIYCLSVVLITLGGVTLRSVIVDVLFVERVTESVCGIVSINNSFVQKNSYCLL